MTIEVSRRGFLKSTGVAGAALVVGLNTSGALAASGSESTMVVNPFVRIDADGKVHVLIKHFEMGQGTTTGLTTMVAEELDAAWANMVPEFAPAGADYHNLMFGTQGTGGSTATPNSWMQYRQAGAAARELIVKAAARKWGVAEADVSVSDGIVSAGGKTGHFGDFIKEAAMMTPSAEPAVKTPDQFRLVGKMDLTRKDNDSKTDGSAIFAMDVKLPGMVYVAIVRSPKFGGQLTGFDAAGAVGIAGFIDAKALPNKAGVAVYGKNTWAVYQAKNAIEATWDFSAAEERGSDAMFATMKEQAKADAEYSVENGDKLAAIQNQIAGAAETLDIEYTFPMLSHAPMETLNCVIEATDDGGVLLHDGCQFPGITQPVVAATLGLEPEKVQIRTVYAGGSFGRRATPSADYQVEAALAFDLLGRKTPVKLVWTREDDIQGGYYRPSVVHKASIGFDDKGALVGWDHRIVAKSILKGTPFEGFLVKDGVDHTSIEGISHSPYKFDQMAIGLSDFQTAVPVLWWRAVGHTHTAYAMETLVDVIAGKAGVDPVEFRLAQLAKTDGKEQQRMAGVIKAAADLADWNGLKAAGRHVGLASHYSFSTYVAVIAEVTETDGDLHVANLWIAVDCGIAINPDVIKAQMEGGAGYGLAAVLRDEITLEDGVVVQENFPDYEPLRIGDMPDVEVSIVTSNESPTGVGEPATPPTGPAVANAIYAATGKRPVNLPFTKDGFSFA